MKSINAVASDVRRIFREIKYLQKVLLNEEFILKYVRNLEERGILPESVKKNICFHLEILLVIWQIYQMNLIL